MSEERFIYNNSGQDIEISKEDIKPIKKIFKDKTNRKLTKSLKPKDSNPSWWIRSRRKCLIRDLISALQASEVKKAWAHNHFISAQERKSKIITIYVELRDKSIDVHNIDRDIDSLFKRRKVNIIDINSLQPSIKEFVFKDVSPLF